LGPRKAAALVVLATVAIFAVVRRDAAPDAPTGEWIARAGLQARELEVDGLRVRYVRAGSGTPVVLLHGLASSIYTWKDVMPVLAARHDVVALDLPGFGASSIPPEPSIPLYVKVVTGAMDRLGLARAALVGNSLGGAIAVAVAAAHPDRVDALVLVDAAGYNFRPQDRPFVLRVPTWVPEPLAESMPVRPMVKLGLRQVFHDDSKITPERLAEYVAPMRRPGASRYARRLLAGADSWGFPEVIRTVRARTLVLWGRYDAWIPLADAWRFGADIPGSPVRVLEAGHMPQEEKPEETAAAIVDFLARPAPPGGKTP
jgi:pimeloyl-ACP methyl ester carboxylesterase